MNFLDVASRVVRTKELSDEGGDVADQDSFVVQSMADLAQVARKHHVTQEEQVASLIMMAAIEKAKRTNPDEEDEDRGTNVLFRFLSWIEDKAEKFVVKFIFKSIFRLVKWVVKELVTTGIRLMLNWLIRPIITEGLAFLILNPEISIPLIGAGALGYMIYDKFFSENSVEELKARNLTDEIRSRMPSIGDEELDEVLGGVGDVQSIRSPLLIRQGVSSQAENLKALIGRGEGSYSSVNTGGKHGYGAATYDLENMTVSEVMQHQQAGDFNAAGRYQIIKSTLASAVKYLGLTGSEKFNKDTQDRIFESYLITIKRRQIGDYISGRSDDLTSAILAVAQEWASVGTPPGYRTQNGTMSDGTTSYYKGVANNKASISAFEMATILQQERAKAMGEVPSNSSVQSGVLVYPVIPDAGQAPNKVVPGSPTSGGQSSAPVQDVVRGPQNTLIGLR